MFTPSHYVAYKCYKMHLGLKNVLLDSILCSKSLELLVFSSCKMLWRKVTMVLRPFTRHNFKNSAIYDSCKFLLSKTTNINIRDHRKYQYSKNWGKKVVRYLLAKVWSQWLVLLEMNWYILLKCLVCAKAHSSFVLKHITSMLNYLGSGVLK